MAVMIPSQEETYFILIIEVLSSMRILVKVFPFKPLESLKKCMIYMYRAYTLILAPLCQETSAPSHKFFLHPTEIVVAHLIVTELKTASVSFWSKSQGNIDGRDRKGAVAFLPLFKSQLLWHRVSKVCFRSNAGGRPVEGYICSCTTHARLHVHSTQVTDLQLTKIWDG